MATSQRASDDRPPGRPAGWSPTGSTRVAAVIGDPVRHSLSPLILNTAFRALDLDWVFVALPVAPGEAAAALAGMRTFGIDGLSVTMPHKTAVAGAVDVRSPAAEALQAVNCVVRRGGELEGHNTDGPGFLAGLRADTGFDPGGHRCVVVGAGGAARAVVLALAGAGADEVIVVNRTAANAQTAAALAGAAGRVGTADDLQGADLIVNATSVGMARAAQSSDHSAVPFAVERIAPTQIVADLVYLPLTTALVAGARARGATAVNGVSMLVHQAAASFEMWTGESAPVDAMTAAVDEAITRGSAA